MGTENGSISITKHRNARLIAYCALAAVLPLSACDGGDSKPNAVPTTNYEAQLADARVATDGTVQTVRFSVQSNNVDTSTPLVCQWQPDANAVQTEATSFECHVGDDNWLDFNSMGSGNFTGRVSVTLPDGTTASSLVDYVVQEEGSGEPLTNVNDEFSEAVSDAFYIFQSGSARQTAYFFPKQAALTSAPGIASTQLSDKIEGALEFVLQKSETDWAAQNQLTFSSRLSLDVDTQPLRDEAEGIGFGTVSEVEVLPPSMRYMERYTTDIPQERIVISCDDLSQDINGRLVTLLDCYIADSNDEHRRTPINLIQSLFFEPVDFDPSTLISNASIRGNFNIVYTLPGTVEFNRLTATNNADLSQTFQLYLKWPLIDDEVKSAVVSFHWQDIAKKVKEQVSSGTTAWSEEAIAAFTETMIDSGYIVTPGTAGGDAAFINALADIVKQEFFVSIMAASDLSHPLLLAPKLRFNDVNAAQPQDRAVQYFNSAIDLQTELDLTCISWPDVQNNVYHSPDCTQ